MAEKQVARAEIARQLRLSEREIANLVRDGKLDDGTAFPSRVRGRQRTFPPDACFRWYIRFKQEEAVRRVGNRPQQGEMQNAEMRKAVVEAELAELKLQRLRGEIVPLEEYRKELSRVAARLSARIDTVVPEFAPRIVEPLELPRAYAILRELARTLKAQLQVAGRTASSEPRPDKVASA